MPGLSRLARLCLLAFSGWTKPDASGRVPRLIAAAMLGLCPSVVRGDWHGGVGYVWMLLLVTALTAVGQTMVGLLATGRVAVVGVQHATCAALYAAFAFLAALGGATSSGRMVAALASAVARLVLAGYSAAVTLS